MKNPFPLETGFLLMRISLIVLFFFPALSFSQVNVGSISIPNPEKKNIVVQKLYSDSLASSFMIIVEKEVKLHKHAYHTEHVYVLEGSGTMTVGKKSFDISPGSVVFIPMDTPHSVKVKESPLRVLSVQSPEFFGKDRIMLE